MVGWSAAELAVEVSESTTGIDFGAKLALYQRVGVREYISIETLMNGVYRSNAFPGLWLHHQAFWGDDGGKIMETLQAGLASEEHEAFAAKLRKRLAKVRLRTHLS